MKKILSLSLVITILALVCLSSCAPAQDAVDYSDSANWAYLENEESDKRADIFFVCPTVYFGDENTYNMPLDDSDAKESFLGATNMEKGIYDGEGRFFAPYYRQAGLNVYAMEESKRGEYLDYAFFDVKCAFEYYKENYGGDRPIILAGFSQGADMCIRLLKECFDSEELQNRLVACYAIGWRLTEADTKQYPQLKAAQSESDTGVIITFNSEAEDVTDSLLVPKGAKTLAINPLNWKTDSTYADKSLNKGACFTDYDGNITREVPALTGAFIDPERGTLKVADIAAEDYPASLNIFKEGVYHLYDYQFFYRNLEENVSVRLDAFTSEN